MKKLIKPNPKSKKVCDRLDMAIERCFVQNCCGLQIPILEIGKIFREARAAFWAAMDTSAATTQVELMTDAEAAIKQSVLATVAALQVRA